MMNAFSTKKAGGLAMLLLLAVSATFRAFAIKPVETWPSMCEGVSVPIADFNGGLYTLEEDDDPRSLKIISKASGRVYDFSDDNADYTCRDSIVTPMWDDCEYLIEYKKKNGTVAEPVTVRIDAYKRPNITAELRSTDLLHEGAFCPGVEIEIAYTSNTPIFVNAPGEARYDPNITDRGAVIRVRPEHSGTITILASNGHCPVSEKSFTIDVWEPPTLDNITLDWKPDFGGDGRLLCERCGFMPELNEIVGPVLAVDRILANPAPKVEWVEGGTAELPLEAGTIQKDIRLEFWIERSVEHCDVTASVKIDTTVSLRLNVKDCKPTIPSRFSIHPCEEKALLVANTYYNTVDLDAGAQAPQLTRLGSGGSWVLPESPAVSSVGGRQNYSFNIGLNGYNGPSDNTLFRISGSARLNCPFGKTQSVALLYDDTVRTEIDTVFIKEPNITYEYCPGKPIDLDIVLPVEQGVLGEVYFLAPDGVGALFQPRVEVKPNNWYYTSLDNVSDPVDYTPLQLAIIYSISNCNNFTSRQEIKKVLKTKEGCDMGITISGSCAGADYTARLTGEGAKDVVVDSIVIDSVGDFMVNIKGFADGKLTFNPYYSLSTLPSPQSTGIVFTAYYKLNGSGAQNIYSEKKEVTAGLCPPTMQLDFSYTSDYILNDFEPCPHCPGTEGKYTVNYSDAAATDPNKTVIDLLSVPYTPIVRVTQNTSTSYQFITYFYEDTKIAVKITYNQGDSICEIVYDDKGDFVMEESCRLRCIVDNNRDSCCEGDRIDAFVINGNMASHYVLSQTGPAYWDPYETFQHLVWDESVLPYVDESCKISTPYGLGVSGEQSDLTGTLSGASVNLGRGFKVRVKASPDGVYPFTVYSKVRDSVVPRPGTLRLYTIPKPYIFIQDTVFVCTGDKIKVDAYIDSSVITSVTPDNVWNDQDSIVIHMGGDVFYATAMMRYVCGDGSGDGRSVTDTLVVLADSKVYLALGFNPDIEVLCAQEDTLLTVPTNGRVTWYRQVSKANSLSNRELLGENMRFNEGLYQRLGSDTLLYTVEVRTTCPDENANFRSGSFYVKPKPLPHVDIIEDGFCGGTIYLEADTITRELAGLEWFNMDKGQLITGTNPTADNGATVICKVYGKNGCINADTATMVSTPIPVIHVEGGGADNTVCFSKGDTVRFTMEKGASSSNPDNMEFWWYMDNFVNEADTIAREAQLQYVYKGDRDTVVYFRAGTNSVCDTFGRVFIKMNPEPRAETDTTVCFGSDVYFYAPSQAGVIYSWSWLDDDGRLVSTDCNCPLGFAPFESEDARREYTLTFTRGKCVIEQKIHFDTFVDPHLTVTGPEGVCEGAAEVTFLADYDASVIQSAEKPRFKWMTPADTTGFIPNWPGWTIKNRVGPADSGVYSVQALINGCLYADSIRFKVSPQVTARFVSENFARSYCEGDSLRVTAVYAGEGALYSWHTPNVNKPFSTDTVLRIESLTVADAGNIYLVVKNEYCSDSTSPKSIEVREIPSITLTAEVLRDGYGRYVYCMGDDIVVTIPEALSGDNITWFLPAGEVAGPDAPASWGPVEASDETTGVYRAVLVRGGCVSDTARLETTVHDLPVLHIKDTSFCDADGRIVVDADFDGAYPDAHYRWSMSDLDRSWMMITDTGFFTVEISLNGCSTVDTFHISRRYAPVWEFYAGEDEICVGDSVILTGPEDADTYLWETPEGPSRERVFVARRDGVYELTATKSGCPDERSFVLTTDYCTSPLFFAEIFSPNSSVDANRYFGPITTVGPEELDYALYIFDINGQMVFKSTDLHEVWNGTVLNGGKECPIGIYYYRCDAVIKKNDRDISTRGMIRLLR